MFLSSVGSVDPSAIIFMVILFVLSVLIWIASKYVAKGVHIIQYPIRSLFYSIKEALQPKMKKMGNRVSEKFDLDQPCGKWGSKGMIWFMIFAGIVSLIRIVIGAIMEGDEIADTLLTYTTVGGLIGLLDGGEGVMAAQSLLTIILVGLATDKFMNHCKEQGLPIGTQLLYDTVFIIFCACVRSLIPAGLITIVVGDWSLMSLGQLIPITGHGTIVGTLLLMAKVFLQVIGIVWTVVLYYVVIVVIASALCNVMGSVVCGTFGLAGAMVISLLLPDNGFGRVIYFIAAIVCIIGASMLSMHTDILNKLLRGKLDNQKVHTVNLRDFKPVYNGLTLFLAGAIGAPLLYTGLVLMILSFISPAMASSGAYGVIIFVVFLLLFIVSAIPGFSLIRKREEPDAVMSTSMAFLKKAFCYVPCVAAGLIGSVVWLVAKVIRRPIEKEPWLWAVGVMFEDTDEAIYNMTAKCE